MKLTEEIRHFDEVVEDVVKRLLACTGVQQTTVARFLRVNVPDNGDVVEGIRELISARDFPARQLADLASRLLLSRYRYDGDSLFSVMHADGPDFQELVANRDLDNATKRFLEIASTRSGMKTNLTEDQAQEIVAALIPARGSRGNVS